MTTGPASHDWETFIRLPADTPAEVLEDLAEEVLDALVTRMRLIALGPAVAVDLERPALHVLVTVAGDPEEVFSKLRRMVLVVDAVIARHMSDAPPGNWSMSVAPTAEPAVR